MKKRCPKNYIKLRIAFVGIWFFSIDLGNLCQGGLSAGFLWVVVIKKSSQTIREILCPGR